MEVKKATYKELEDINIKLKVDLGVLEKRLMDEVASKNPAIMLKENAQKEETKHKAFQIFLAFMSNSSVTRTTEDIYTVKSNAVILSERTKQVLKSSVLASKHFISQFEEITEVKEEK